MSEVIYVDPHDPKIEQVVAGMFDSLRDAPEGSSLNVDRDTMRAVLGQHKLLVAALDDMTEVVRSVREISFELDAALAVRNIRLV